MSKMEWYITMCDYSIKKKETCDYCNTNNKLPDFYIQTPSYYRNKSSGHFFFCSNDCKTKYKNEKVCKYCGYDQDLKKPEGENFMLCTDYAFQESCYDKYIRENSPPESHCSFCNRFIDKEKLYCKKDICSDCFEVYKNIVLLNECENHNNDCVFCEKSNCNHIFVNGYSLCNECFCVYKNLVLENEN